MKFNSKMNQFFFSPTFIKVLLAAGVVLRLRQYLYNRSLWLDEASLAVNFLTRSFGELLTPLRHHEIVPVGFLLTEKLAVLAFGPSEYALRLFPLLAGIAALFLFHRLAQNLLEKSAVALAVGLFAILQPLIYFSSEAKQYSFDVLATVVILWMAVNIMKTPTLTWSRALGCAVLGAACAWCSHPAAFVLTGAAFVVAGDVYRRKRALPRSLIIVSVVWIVSLAAAYLFSKRYVLATTHDYLKDYWKEGFMPLVPHSFGDLQWYMRTLFGTFEYPGGLTQSGLAALACVGGIVGFLSRRNTVALALIVSPIALTLTASAFHLYPFFDRLILFLVPVLILLIAAGAVGIARTLRGVSLAVAVAYLGMLLLQPVANALSRAVVPIEREEARPVIRYLEGHMQPGDTLYIYNGALKAFDYYAALDGFAPAYIAGINSRQDVRGYLKDLAQLDGRGRVWILFSHIWTTDRLDERAFILNYLDTRGRRLDAFEVHSDGNPGLEAGDAAVYLYDLSR